MIYPTNQTYPTTFFSHLSHPPSPRGQTPSATDHLLPCTHIYIYTHPIWNQPSPHRKHRSSRTTPHLHTIIRSSNTAFPTPRHHHLSEPVITILGRHPYSSQPHHHNHHFWKPIAPLRLSPRSTTHLYLLGKQRHRRPTMPQNKNNIAGTTMKPSNNNSAGTTMPPNKNKIAGTTMKPSNNNSAGTTMPQSNNKYYSLYCRTFWFVRLSELILFGIAVG